MPKKIKLWNGRGHYKLDRHHISVAAYSQKQAAELVGKACGYSFPIGISEIRNYYSPCWGGSMTKIDPNPQTPRVYAAKNMSSDYKLILKLKK